MPDATHTTDTFGETNKSIFTWRFWLFYGLMSSVVLIVLFVYILPSLSEESEGPAGKPGSDPSVPIAVEKKTPAPSPEEHPPTEAEPSVVPSAKSASRPTQPREKTNTSVVFFCSTPRYRAQVANGLRGVLAVSGRQVDLQVAGTIDEATASSASVVILWMYGSIKPSPALLDALREKRVVGVGYGSARLFGELDLEIHNGACNHDNWARAPKIKVVENGLIRNPDEKGAFTAMRITPRGPADEHIFFMSFHPRSHLGSAVEAVARMEDQPLRAPIVRQGNFVLVGLYAPPSAWSAPYRAMFRKLVDGLRSRPDMKTEPAKWPVAKAGRHTFRLEQQGPASRSTRAFYFKFDRPLRFSASLRVEGAKKVELSFVGERRGVLRTRKQGGASAPLNLAVEITEKDLKKLGDRYWRLDVSNKDPDAEADCSMEVRY